MNLEQYISSFNETDRSAVKTSLINFLGITPAALRHWLNGTRRPCPQHVLNLETFSKGRIRRHDERPDIYPAKELKHKRNNKVSKKTEHPPL